MSSAFTVGLAEVAAGQGAQKEGGVMKRKREQINAPGAKFQIGSIVEIAGEWRVVGIRKSGVTFIYEIEHADTPTMTVSFFEARLR